MHFNVINVTTLSDMTHRFDVSLHTGLGVVYLRGFRMAGDGRIIPPSFNVGGNKWKAYVKLPTNLRAAIRNRIIKQLRAEAREYDSND